MKEHEPSPVPRRLSRQYPHVRRRVLLNALRSGAILNQRTRTSWDLYLPTEEGQKDTPPTRIPHKDVRVLQAKSLLHPLGGRAFVGRVPKPKAPKPKRKRGAWVSKGERRRRRRREAIRAAVVKAYPPSGTLWDRFNERSPIMDFLEHGASEGEKAGAARPLTREEYVEGLESVGLREEDWPYEEWGPKQEEAQ